MPPLDLAGPWGEPPPADLISRVTQQFTADTIEQNRRDFFRLAALNLISHERALNAQGVEFSDMRQILDFGCGPGRFLRPLAQLAPATQLHGVDVDAELVEWAQENIPQAKTIVGPHEPPLPYADHQFDLIINHSVFTHLDEHHQDLWLAELARIVKPGGYLLLTVHSTRQFNEAMRDMGDERETFRAELEGRGICFIADDNFVGTTHPDWYHTTFHAPWYIYEHWTERFDLKAHHFQGSDTQDLVVLQAHAERDPLLAPIGHGLSTTPSGGRSATSTEEGEVPEVEVLAELRKHLEESPPLTNAGTHLDEAGRDLEQVPRAGLKGRLARALGAGRGVAAISEAVRELTSAQAAARHTDWLTLQTLVERQDLLYRLLLERIEVVSAEIASRDRSLGVLRGALDEQAQRSAVAIAEIRRTIRETTGATEPPVTDGRSDAAASGEGS